MAGRKPEWIPEYKRYDAWYCGLSQIPDEILREPLRHQVRWINLNANKIEDLPPNIGTLWPELRTLWLSSNKLRYIPESVGDLKKLEELDVEGNPLEGLPASLTRLTNLETFFCDPIEGVLSEDVVIWNNPTEIRKLWDELFPQKTGM
uniref:Leucine-rich repeat-containing protein 57-like n=1 Tax=Saccoglossus kowalevskii TaxID=10224 RepID=A0ABM0MDT7_SACKO|nr:PREDICTED: leucine-rich repeat-containing protein 57-like [Saccoglossus kowalevskii]